MPLRSPRWIATGVITATVALAATFAPSVQATDGADAPRPAATAAAHAAPDPSSSDRSVAASSAARKKNATVVKHLHTSGLYSGDKNALAADLDRWRGWNHIITATEVFNAQRAAKFEDNGWEVFWVKGRPAAENAVAWRTGRFELVHSETVSLTDQVLYVPSGTSKLGHAASVVLRDKQADKLVLVTAVHMPSRVERNNGKGWNNDDPKRVSAYRDAMKGLRSHVRQLTNQYSPDMRIVAADWNLDFKRPWVRKYMQRTWARVGLWNPTWNAKYPNGGTLEDERDGKDRRRLIDANLLDGAERFRKPVLLREVDSSDHGAYAERVRYRS